MARIALLMIGAVLLSGCASQPPLHRSAQTSGVVQPVNLDLLIAKIDAITPVAPSFSETVTEHMKARALVDQREPVDSYERLLFLVERSQAHALLGHDFRALEDARLAVTLAEGIGNRPHHAYDNLALAAGLVGFPVESSNAKAKDLSSRPSHRGASFSIASDAADIGQLDLAEQYFARGESRIAEYQRANPDPSEAIHHYLMLRSRAAAGILEAKGGVREAEAEWRTGANEARLDLDAAAVRYQRRPSLNPLPITAKFALLGAKSRLAQNLSMQHRFGEAEALRLDIVNDSIDLAGKYSSRTATYLVRLAEEYLASGRHVDSAAILRRAEEIYRSLQLPEESLKYRSLNWIRAESFVVAEQWPEAIATFEVGTAALSVHGVLARHFGRPTAAIALAFVKVGRFEDFIRWKDSGIEPSVPGPYGEAEIEGLHAMALAGLGDQQSALKKFASATEILLKEGTGLSVVEGIGTPRESRLRHILSAYLALLCDRAEALQGSERDKALLVSMGLADRMKNGPVARALSYAQSRVGNQSNDSRRLFDRRQVIRDGIAIGELTLQHLAGEPSASSREAVEALSVRIQSMRQQETQNDLEIATKYPREAALSSWVAFSRSQIDQTLKSGEVLIAAYASPSSIFVWVVRAGHPIHLHRTAVGYAWLRAHVASIRETLTPSNPNPTTWSHFDFGGASELYAALFAPIKSHWENADLLIFSPHDALSQLPISVLIESPPPTIGNEAIRFQSYSEVRWLGLRKAIAYLPSISALVAIRDRAARTGDRTSFLGFGDPSFSNRVGSMAESAAPPERAAATTRQEVRRGAESGSSYAALPPLPETRGEILSMGRALGADIAKDTFFGMQATKSRVLSMDLTRKAVIAFATHGLVPGDLPGLAQPGLALATTNASAEADNPGQSILLLEDVLGLRMNSSWVVLSACNSAASGGAGAEALAGLGRGFFFAGATTLLATHWPVETDSARVLVSETFHAYATFPAINRAQALLIGMRKVASGHQGGPASSLGLSTWHPVFWAPYALYGDSER